VGAVGTTGAKKRARSVVAHAPGPTKPDEGVGVRRCSALQRVLGSEGGPSAPCGASGSLSWGSAALRGLEPGGSGRLSVPPAPFGVSTPCGVWTTGPAGRPKPVGGPPCALRAPSEVDLRSPAPSRPAAPTGVGTGLVRRCFLSWAFAPYDTCQARGCAFVAPDPSDAARRVRGLATPFATSPRALPVPGGTGASMGFPLQGFPLVRDGYSSRSPCPLDGSPPSPASGEANVRSGPPSGPRSRDESVPSPDLRGDPAVDAFLGFTPPEPSPHPSRRRL
jgi:hypothetical protein